MITKLGHSIFTKVGSADFNLFAFPQAEHKASSPLKLGKGVPASHSKFDAYLMRDYAPGIMQQLGDDGESGEAYFGREKLDVLRKGYSSALKSALADPDKDSYYMNAESEQDGQNFLARLDHLRKDKAAKRYGVHWY